MHRIELFGAMATGKSTLYDMLTNDHNRLPAAIRYDDLKRSIMLDDIGRKSKLRKLIYWLVTSNKTLKKDLTFYKLSKNATKAIDDCEINGVKELLHHVLYERRPSACDMSDEVIRVNRFLRDISDLAWLQRRAVGRQVVFDEFLLQRGIALSMGEKANIDSIQEYMKLVPLPDLAIFTYSDPDVIVERMILRDGAQERKLKYLKAMLDVSNAACEILSSRGCDIVMIDARASIIDNYKQCVKKISGQ